MQSNSLIFRDCLGIRHLDATQLRQVARARKSYLETPVGQELAVGLKDFGSF